MSSSDPPTADPEIRAARAVQQLEDVERLANVGLWEWSPGTGAVVWSAQMRRILGHGSDLAVEPSYELWLGSIHPDDRETAQAAVTRGVESGLPFEFEHRVLHPDGTVRHVHCRGSVHVDEAGALERVVGASQDVTDRVAIEDRLRHLAEHDLLTGLRNRHCFETALSAQSAAWARSETAGAVLLIDLDNFKDVNDTRGHQAGDTLVAAVAGRLRDRVRATDVLARIGGDEFAVLVPQADAVAARTVAESLRQVITASPFAVGDARLRVTASIGVALSDTSNRDGDLLADADIALYEAKNRGRDRVALASEMDRATQQRAVGWNERLRHALMHDELVLFGQPIADAVTGAVSRYELLVRLRAQDGSLAPPGAFLPVAERHGLIVELDRLVARHAARIVAAEAAAGRDTRLSVNLSGRTVAMAGIADELLGTIRDEGADPWRLMFEVTETTAIDRLSAAGELATALRSVGATFALDDFGAGFSSFVHLKGLPVDAVKIDGGFVRDCAGSAVDRAVVRSLVDVARALGTQTIAECVEDAATRDLVAGFGVDQVQGFHIGRPAPIDELLRG